MAVEASDYELMTHPTAVGLTDLVRNSIKRGYQLHGGTLPDHKGGFAQAMIRVPEKTGKGTNRRQA